MVVEIARQAGDRDEAVGPALAQGDEEPEARHAVDAAREDVAYPLRQEGRREAVHGLTLGGGGAALGAGDMLADRFEALLLIGTEAVVTQLQPADQRAVHQQVRIAADRRGEVGVARQRQPEVPQVLAAVIGLALAAQDQVVDHLVVGCVPGLLQHPLEGLGTDHLPLGEVQVDGVQELAQRFDLRGVRAFVHPVHAGLLALLQGDGGGHVGGDHELLDQAVAVQPLAPGDGLHAPRIIEDHLAFRDVEVERAARLPRLQKRAERPVKRLQDRLQQRPCGLVGTPVHGLLNLLVGQARGRAHDGAQEAVLHRRPFGVDPDFADQAAALLLRAQGTPSVGKRLRQHGHHAVGEVDRVAALLRRLVEDAAAFHVVRHIGDGDQQMPAARVLRIVVGLRPDRVVEVACVRAVDGDQRHLAEVGPAFGRHRLGGFGLLHGGCGEIDRYLMFVDGDHADGVGAGGVADPLDDANLLGAHGLAALLDLAEHQLALLRAARVVGAQDVVPLGPAVGRVQAPALHARIVNAEDLFDPFLADDPDDAGFVDALLQPRQARQRPLAPVQGSRAALVGHNEDLRRCALALPAVGRCELLAVGIGAGRHDHGDLGQPIGGGQTLAAVPGERAFLAQLADQRFQLLAVLALDLEGARDLALAHGRRAFNDEAAHFFLRGEGGAALRLLCHDTFGFPKNEKGGDQPLPAFSLFLAPAFLAPAFLPPFFWAISSSACSRVTSSTSAPLGRLAKVRLCFT